MKFIWFLLFCAFTLLCSCSTIEHFSVTDRASEWSSSEPLNIPYSTRRARFEKGNLVVNPSFEQGSILRGTSGNESRIKGWQKVGENVHWTDTESANGTSNDANSGRRAVRISRKRANELDEAEGVLSDYIEVIPGNYYFSYHVRLKHIRGSKSRLGSRLQDAVTIKVLFFDENKQPIEPGLLNPVNRSMIDNSNKGLSFANFWRIDDFPWGEVRGRTYNYPFSEGDVPERTRYVRLFLGLRGTGNMWIDDVVYRYSKWNFTALERLQPYFDKPLPLAQRLIPTPRRFQQKDDVTFYEAYQSRQDLPVIVLPEESAPADVSAANLLKKEITAVLQRVMPPNELDRDMVRVEKADYSRVAGSIPRLVFSIGRNKLYKRVQPNLPLAAVQGKSQGYVIQSAFVGDTRIVFLIGETPLANYYAAATAIQLFEADRAVYHDATVIDYPDFLGRSYVFKAWKNDGELQRDLHAISRLSQYKLNKVYLGYGRQGKRWHRPDRLYLQGIEEAGRRCRDSGVMSLAMMVNPYSHLGFERPVDQLSDDLRNTWTHSDPGSIEMLKKHCRPALNAGARTLMLLADDYVPHAGQNRQNYALFTEKDKNQFVSLQNAQAYVINQLKQWLDREYPETRLEFCPPWYSNEHIARSYGQAEYYFKDLTFQIPPDVAIIWTGPTIRSLSIDSADLYRYQSLIGRWPMIWDNTLYARNHEVASYGGFPAHYPSKVRMCNIFEPFDAIRPRAFQNNNHGRQMYTNGPASSEVYKIKYATVADYEWNTTAYNPELSLWKALTKTFGRSAAEQLMYFNDAFYGFYEVYLRLKSKVPDAAHDKRKAEKYLDDMRKYVRQIAALRPDETQLLLELERYLKKQEKRFNAIF